MVTRSTLIGRIVPNICGANSVEPLVRDDCAPSDTVTAEVTADPMTPR